MGTDNGLARGRNYKSVVKTWSIAQSGQNELSLSKKVSGQEGAEDWCGPQTGRGGCSLVAIGTGRWNSWAGHRWRWAVEKLAGPALLSTSDSLGTLPGGS